MFVGWAGVVSPVRAEFDGDQRYWQTVVVRFHEDDNWRISTGGETRLFDDAKYLGAWLLFPTVEYKLHPNLDLGATYLLEDIRAEAGDPYTRLHIFWLHASPHWRLSDHLSLNMRHLIGYRSVESADNYWISRHRFGLSCSLKDWGPLTALGASTEVFYDFKTDRIFENRLIPLQATFRLNTRTQLSLYVMAESRRGASRSDWETAYVFGQSLVFKF